MTTDAAIVAARSKAVRTVSETPLGASRLPRLPWGFGDQPFGNVSGAMYAEYQVPESVPDVPATAPDTIPEIPADPTPPGGDPEPMDIAA